MALPTQIALRGRYVLRNVLGKAGPFDITYLGTGPASDNKKIVIHEYCPTFLAERSADGVSLIPRSMRDKPLFVYGRDAYLAYARRIGQVHHRHIIPQLDLFNENNTTYSIHPYLPGITLSKVLNQQEGRIQERGAFSILNPVLSALHAAHRAGLIHGGISPASIFLTKTGQPMLLRFLMTRIEFAQLCNKTVEIDQPGFIAPEILLRKGKIGPWTDVYGCAATLFSILTGKRLQSTFDRILSDAVNDDIEDAADLRPPLKAVLQRSLSLNLANRPASIELFQTQLLDAVPHDIWTGPNADGTPHDLVKKTSPQTLGQSIHDRAQTVVEVEPVLEEAEVQVESDSYIDNMFATPLARPLQENEPKQKKDRPGKRPRKRSTQKSFFLAVILVLTVAGGAYGIRNASRMAPTPVGALGMPSEVAEPEYASDEARPVWFASLLKADSLLEMTERIPDEADDLHRKSLLIAAHEAYSNAILEGAADTLLHLTLAQIESDVAQLEMREAESIQALALSEQATQQIRLDQGDSLFAAGALDEAKSHFEEILLADPDQAYAADMLEEIVDQLVIADKESSFQQLMRRGDVLAGARRYDEARQVYLQALLLKETTTLVAKIERLESLTAELERTEVEYQYNREVGDEQREAGNYEAALSNYMAALKLKPEDSYMLVHISMMQDSMQASENRSRFSAAEYQRLRDEGDAFFNDAKFEDAIASYNAALSFRPADDYINTQIKKAEEAQQIALRQLVDENGVYLQPDKPPRLIGERQVLGQVRYPRSATEKGIQGRVVLRMVVDEEGRVRDIIVVRGIGYGCDEEAQRVFRNARFEPALFRGQSVPSWFSFTVVFALSG